METSIARDEIASPRRSVARETSTRAGATPAVPSTAAAAHAANGRLVLPVARGASWKKREGQRSRARESGRTRRRRRIAEEAEGSRRFQKQLELPRLVASGERGGGSWIGGEERGFGFQRRRWAGGPVWIASSGWRESPMALVAGGRKPTKAL